MMTPVSVCMPRLSSGIVMKIRCQQQQKPFSCRALHATTWSVMWLTHNRSSLRCGKTLLVSYDSSVICLIIAHACCSYSVAIKVYSLDSTDMPVFWLKYVYFCL